MGGLRVVKTLPISEIFLSSQGEGNSVGTLQCFVRCASCNFWEEGHPCKWKRGKSESACDTAYAGLKSQGKLMTIDEVLEAVGKIGCPSIFITGGEPLVNSDLVQELCLALYYGYHTVEIQTNGSLPIWDSDIVTWSVDLKMPSSSNSGYMDYSNLEKLWFDDQIKCVIANKKDFEFANKIVEKYKPQCMVFYQPAWGILKPEVLVEWMKGRKLWNVRLSLQSQKIIFGANKRGV